MGGRELFVQAESLLANYSAVFDPFGFYVAFVFLPVRVAQTCVRQGVAGVETQGTLEDLDGVLEVFRAVVVLKVTTPLQVIVISSDHLCSVTFESFPLPGLHIEFEHAYGFPYDPILRREGVLRCHRQAPRADLAALAGIYKHAVDAHMDPRP